MATIKRTLTVTASSNIKNNKAMATLKEHSREELQLITAPKHPEHTLHTNTTAFTHSQSCVIREHAIHSPLIFHHYHYHLFALLLPSSGQLISNCYSVCLFVSFHMLTCLFLCFFLFFFLFLSSLFPFSFLFLPSLIYL